MNYTSYMMINNLTPMNKKLNETKAQFIRDITKVMPMPKSEAKRRLDEIIKLAIKENDYTIPPGARIK